MVNLDIGGPLLQRQKRRRRWSPTEEIGWSRTQEIRWYPTEEIGWVRSEEILHIDFLQIRNGAIHIVDYKPGAKSEKPIPQLMTYALALSRRTGLKLFHFVCSWFDAQNYYQFFPLHVVHKRGRTTEDETLIGPPSSA